MKLKAWGFLLYYIVAAVYLYYAIWVLVTVNIGFIYLIF